MTSTDTGQPDARCGAAHRTAWWRRASAWMLGAALLAAVVTAVLGAPVATVVQTTSIAGILAGVAHYLVGRASGPAVHAHCDTCGLCSVTAGVPAARTSRRSDAALTAAGWRTTPTGALTCPNCAGDQDGSRS